MCWGSLRPHRSSSAAVFSHRNIHPVKHDLENCWHLSLWFGRKSLRADHRLFAVAVKKAANSSLQALGPGPPRSWALPQLKSWIQEDEIWRSVSSSQGQGLGSENWWGPIPPFPTVGPAPLLPMMVALWCITHKRILKIQTKIYAFSSSRDSSTCRSQKLGGQYVTDLRTSKTEHCFPRWSTIRCERHSWIKEVGSLVRSLFSVCLNNVTDSCRLNLRSCSMWLNCVD